MNYLLEFLGRMDQRLGRDAADVEAGAASLDGFDDDGIDPELPGADGTDIATRTGADDEKFADDLFHGHQLSMKISAGVSSNVFIRWTKVAASHPSTTR